MTSLQQYIKMALSTWRVHPEYFGQIDPIILSSVWVSLAPLHFADASNSALNFAEISFPIFIVATFSLHSQDMLT